MTQDDVMIGAAVADTDRTTATTSEHVSQKAVIDIGLSGHWLIYCSGSTIY